MNRFSKAIAPYVRAELKKASELQAQNNWHAAFTHLETAHVLGQESTYWHVKVHGLMLLWGIRQRDAGEIVGQLIRIVGAALLTAVKAVPGGNTGGSNVSQVAPMPIKAVHAEIIARAKAKP